MGTNSSTSHQSYVVAPAPAADGAPPPAAAEPETTATPPLFPLPEPDADPAAVLAGYEAIHDAAVNAEQDLLLASVAEKFEDLPGLEAQVNLTKQAAQAWLAGLTPEQLQQLAAEQGFEHPALVGLSGPSALQHWLDPSYPAESPSKAKIQAVAQSRYAALCAGETVGGMTLADLQVLEGPTAAADGSWAATPADIVIAQTALLDKVAALTAAATKHWGGATLTPDAAAALSAAVEAENRLFTADCPELGDQLGITQAAGRHLLDQALHKTSVIGAVDELRAGVGAGGTLPAGHADLLKPGEVVAYARLSTPAAERAILENAAENRAETLAKLMAATDIYSVAHPSPHGPLALPGLDTADGQAQLAAFAHSAQAVYDAKTDMLGWATQVNLSDAEKAAASPHAHAGETELTQQFRAWAKGQKLADLRVAATDLGLTDAAAASRAQVQNYIAAQWNTALSSPEIQAAVTAAATPKPAPAPPPAPTPAPAAPTPTSPTTAPSSGPGAGATPKHATTVVDPSQLKANTPPGSWAAQHQALVGGLKLAAASSTDVPARLSDTAVNSWNFGPGTAAALGGSHAKTLHTGPDGGTWMFKVDTTGGARAHAEAAASEVFARAGLPTVPVYPLKLGAKTGSVQPLLKGATHLSADPKAWTQADVDALVRSHVAAWAISDHDGKPDNVLRTAAGGIVAIDQGQAGKFLGDDKLSLSYNPNGTVFHAAYTAQLTGALPKGVRVRPSAAHPVIKAIEQIPDTQWRSILHSFAHQRAKDHGASLTAIRTRAAAHHKVPTAQLTTQQVAETMLDVLVERKHTLRQSFAVFFDKEVKVPGADTLLKVGR